MVKGLSHPKQPTQHVTLTWHNDAGIMPVGGPPMTGATPSNSQHNCHYTWCGVIVVVNIFPFYFTINHEHQAYLPSMIFL
jgi:hypothetical protein